MMPNRFGERTQLSFGRQFSVDQQVRNFKEVRLLGQRFDGNATVFKNTFVAINERDCAFGRAGVAIAGIIGDQTGLGTQFGDINGVFLLRA